MCRSNEGFGLGYCAKQILMPRLGQGTIFGIGPDWTRLDPIGPALSLALHLDRADASCKTSHSVKYLAIKTSKPLSQAHEARARCVAYSAEPAESKRETKVKSCGTPGTLYARLAFWAGHGQKQMRGKNKSASLKVTKSHFAKAHCRHDHVANHASLLCRSRFCTPYCPRPASSAASSPPRPRRPGLRDYNGPTVS
jgi:hypothetical protein